MSRGQSLATAVVWCCSHGMAGAATDHSDDYSPVWATVEADRVRTQASLGTTETTHGPADVAIDLVLTQGYAGVDDPLRDGFLPDNGSGGYRAPSLRLEAGPAFSQGPVFVLPRLGIGYDFARRKAGPLVPQAVAILQLGPGYIESRVELHLFDLFEAGARDSIYTRHLFLLALSNAWAVGAQIEAVIAVGNPPGRHLRNLPFGGRVNWAPTEWLTLGAFVGLDLPDRARLAARATATVAW